MKAEAKRDGAATDEARAQMTTLKNVLAEQVSPGELYDAMPDRPGWVHCYACGHLCRIPPGRDGICRVRFNRDGVLMVPDGYVGALQCDPVEKKPFFHALPGSLALSFGMLGCDYHCAYCFTGETRVVTRRGVVRIDSLLRDERLLMPDGGEAASSIRGSEALTHEGRFSPIRQVFRHPYRGRVVKVTPYYLPPFRCTPDHRIYATSDPSASPQWMEARLLTSDHYLVVPKPKVSASVESIVFDTADILGDIQHAYRVPRLEPDRVQAIMAASSRGQTSFAIGESMGIHPFYVRHVGSKVRRGAWNYSRIGGLEVADQRVRSFKGHRPEISRFLSLDDDLARLLGLYCAEGWVIRARNRSNSCSVVLTFGPKEQDLAEEARLLLEKIFGPTAFTVRRPTSLAVTLSKTSAALFFQTVCGARASEKRVPPELMVSDLRVARTFLEAFVRGDGHTYPNGKISVTTISEDLAYGIAFLALRAGFLPSIYPAPLTREKKIEGRAVRQAPAQYTVRWYPNPITRRARETADHFLVPIRRTVAESYEGPVYNLEVEDSHTYTANFLAVHNCQNWITSQALRDPASVAPPMATSPEDLVGLARRYGAPILASTYNEPLITSEWAVKVFRHAKEAGLVCAYISNGNATPRVLDYLRPWVDLYKVDLKGFDEKRYHELGGVLQTVLETIVNLKQRGFWVEVVTLIVPGFNDGDDELTGIARFLAGVDRDIPWHVTAFHQDYKMTDRPDTSVDTLIRAAEIGRAAGLHFVYAGNRPGKVGDHENTRCPQCGSLLIERSGYTVLDYRIRDNRCPQCAAVIPGVWSRAPRRAAGARRSD